MADDLASLISGTDPLAPVELRAYQQQQLLNSARDASQWANQGPFGALARTLAGFSGGPAQNTVAQIAAARAQNNPQLFQALASGNPYQWGANTANGASPLTLSGILANAPSSMEAQYKGLAALSMLAQQRSLGANLPGMGLPGLTAPTVPPNAGAAPPSTNAPVRQSVVAPMPVPAPTAPVVGVAGALQPPPPSDIGAWVHMPASAKQAYIQSMTPQQQAQFAQRVRLYNPAGSSQ